MKKIALLSFIIISLLACSDHKEINPNFQGHWINEAYLTELDKVHDPSKINIPCEELVFRVLDSNMSYFNIGVEVKTLRYEPIAKYKIQVNKFGQQEQVVFELAKNGQKLSYTHPITKEVINFIKIDPKEIIDGESKKTIISQASALINKKLIAGTYSLINNDNKSDISANEVIFSTNGTIKGLDKFKNYSFCIQGDCRKFSKNALVFLSNEKNEGFYYEWEKTADTVRIFSLDASRFPNQMSNFKRKSVIYTLKKRM